MDTYKKNPLQMYENTLNTSKQGAQDLLSKYYGTNAQFDPNKQFSSYGNPINTMDDKTRELAANDYNNYLQQYLSATQAQTAYKTLADEQQESRERASLINEKIMAYLPQQMQQYGLGNLGVSQSAVLQQGTNYQRQLGEIDQNIGARQGDIWQSYLSASKGMQDNAYKNTENILGRYQAIDEQKRNELYSQTESDLSLATSSTDIDKIISAYKNNSLATKDQVTRLERYAETIKKDPAFIQYQKELEQADIDKKQADLLAQEYSYKGNVYKHDSIADGSGRGTDNVIDLKTVTKWQEIESIADNRGRAKNNMAKDLFKKIEKSEKIDNGTLFDFNNGKNVYVYIDGKLYPVSKA